MSQANGGWDFNLVWLKPSQRLANAVTAYRQALAITLGHGAILIVVLHRVFIGTQERHNISTSYPLAEHLTLPYLVIM